MAAHAPDVLLAVEFIERVDLHRWSRIGDDLLKPTPRVHHEDAAHLDDVLAWAAAHTGQPRSHVHAAVVNAARVLEDLILVLHYEMDFRDNHYWVTQWYRRSYGQAVNARRVEEFGVHVALIHNLIIELNRACNLVIDRARQADPGVLAGAGSAVVPTGPGHAPVQAVRYSDDEAADPQPYPGLATFPAAVQDGRQVGLLGKTTYDEPRTVTAFLDWIAHLVRERGPHSDSPPSDDLPFALPTPTGDAGADASPPSKSPPSPWRAVAGIVTAGSVIAGLLASFPWLVGATVGGALLGGLLHRRVWRIPPETIPTIVVIAAAVAGAVFAEIIVGDHDDKPKRGGPERPRAPTAKSPPATRKTGQIEGGNSFRARARSDAAFSDPALAVPGRTVALRFQISNAGPDQLVGARLKAQLPDTADRSVSVTATGSARNANPRTDTVTVTFARSRAACLSYVAASTRLLDANGGVLRALPDGVTGAGVEFGSVSVSLDDVRYVDFKVRATAASAGRRCA